jgi:hypothetical protein
MWECLSVSSRGIHRVSHRESESRIKSNDNDNISHSGARCAHGTSRSERKTRTYSCVATPCKRKQLIAGLIPSPQRSYYNQYFVLDQPNRLPLVLYYRYVLQSTPGSWGLHPRPPQTSLMNSGRRHGSARRGSRSRDLVFGGEVNPPAAVSLDTL